jgi:hypothetical protein
VEFLGCAANMPTSAIGTPRTGRKHGAATALEWYTTLSKTLNAMKWPGTVALIACVEPDPEQSVRAEEPRATWALPLQDSRLMPHSDHRKLPRSPATKAERQEGGHGGTKGDHRHMCYNDGAENLWHS